ncbi:MAG: hypothetical protein ACI4RC_00370 [Oscillospiraceae bacterium]
MEKNTKSNMNFGKWKVLALFLLGVITGFLFAPIKDGIKICCDNKDSMNANIHKDDECKENSKETKS